MIELDIKQAFLTHLLSNLPTGMTSADVAFENKKFDPSGKDAWIAAYFINNVSTPLGKTSNDFDDDSGVLQVSVFVPIRKNSNDNELFRIISELRTAFRYNTEMLYNEQKVYVTSTSLNSATESGGFYKRDLTINYFTLSERG